MAIELGTAPSAIIPRPIQVVIDDVGWWSGRDGSKLGEPFRTGIDRNHVVADYQAIVDLGKTLGIRPQAAMVLCEWDRENILRDLPESTWMGRKWDNSGWVGPWLDQAADLIRQNTEYVELSLHGIGHEYWTDGKMSRAEWATADGTMRPVEQILRHLEYFEKIMQQNNLGSFPVSFVPAAFNHGFGRTGDHPVSLAGLLKERGIEYINTPFRRMQHADAIGHGFFGIDAGVLTVDRGRDLLPWDAIGTLPDGELKGPTCGMHWPNILHPDPVRNSKIVAGWVAFLKPYDDRFDTMLAKDSVQFQQQLVHHACTDLKVNAEEIELDFAQSDEIGHESGRKDLTVKIRSRTVKSFASESLEITSLHHHNDQEGMRYTLRLHRMGIETKARIRMS
jgi:hypothetical protein